MEFYPNISTIDLREAMHAILFGSHEMVPNGRPLLLRELTDTFCPVCWDKLSGGPKMAHCDYCDGEGFLWTERMFTGYLTDGTQPLYKSGFMANGQYPLTGLGDQDPNRATCFVEWSTIPDYERYTYKTQKAIGDRLFELKVRPDGGPDPLYPMVRTAKWKILTVTPRFGDFGRIEYIELGIEKENIS